LAAFPSTLKQTIFHLFTIEESPSPMFTKKLAHSVENISKCKTAGQNYIFQMMKEFLKNLSWLLYYRHG
jgi:hypothetical protein